MISKKSILIKNIYNILIQSGFEIKIHDIKMDDNSKYFKIKKLKMEFVILDDIEKLKIIENLIINNISIFKTKSDESINCFRRMFKFNSTKYMKLYLCNLRDYEIFSIDNKEYEIKKFFNIKNLYFYRVK